MTEAKSVPTQGKQDGLADAIADLADRKRKISGARCGIIVSVKDADRIVAALRSATPDAQPPRECGDGWHIWQERAPHRLKAFADDCRGEAKEYDDMAGRGYRLSAETIANAYRRIARELDALRSPAASNTERESNVS